jgi:hypothetical protein
MFSKTFSVYDSAVSPAGLHPSAASAFSEDNSVGFLQTKQKERVFMPICGVMLQMQIIETAVSKARQRRQSSLAP